MPRTDNYAQTQPASRAEWRQWLAENHASLPGVRLVYCKQQPSGRALRIPFPPATQAPSPGLRLRFPRQGFSFSISARNGFTPISYGEE